MTIRLWGNEKLVNTTTLNGQSKPVITTLQNGGYVIAWVDDMGAGLSAVKFQRFDASGNKLGAETTVPSVDNEGDQDQVSICTLANGNFIIAHRDADPLGNGSEIATSRYSASGTFLGRTTAANLEVFQPTVHAEGQGFVMSVSFQANSTDTDPFLYTFDANGIQTNTTALDGTISLHLALDVDVGSNTFGRLPVLYADNNSAGATFNTLYLTFADLAGPRYAIDTTTLATPFTDAHVKYLKPAGGPTQYYVVSYIWQSKFLFFKIVTNDGTTLQQSSIFSVTSNTSRADSHDIQVLNDGTFIVLWTDFEGTQQKVHLQQFDSNGAKLGVELLVNTNGDQLTEFPVIEALSDGRLVAVWADSSGTSDGSGSAVLQQILDPREGVINGTDVAAVAETLYGHDIFNDQILGFAGNDTMFGLAGSDSLYGGDGLDVLNGGRGDDTLYGGNDADALNGEAGDDLLFGEAGSDRMSGGLGADELDGGAGDDGVSFRGAKAGVAVNLLTGVGTAGEAAGDTYVNMESFFGSEFADTVIGGAVAGGFYGFGGDDNITGTAGVDRLIGGLGNDTINGLGGTDRVYYDTSLAPVQVNLATNVNTGGEAQGDILSNIEEVSGSAFGDTIIGKSGAERLIGNGGTDRLEGATGADFLTGGAGSDTFVFALGHSGQTTATLDTITDYTRGQLGVGDVIDYGSALTIGGSNLAATANEASINTTNGVASFATGSGTTLADALSDIATRMTTAGDAVGEFALFQIGLSTQYMFISDGSAGVTTGDVVVQFNGQLPISTISLDNGDLTILS